MSPATPQIWGVWHVLAGSSRSTRRVCVGSPAAIAPCTTTGGPAQGVADGVAVLVAVGGVPVTVSVGVAAGPERHAATIGAVLFIESALWAELGAFSSTPVGQPL